MVERSGLPDIKEHLCSIVENAKRPIDGIIGDAQLIMREETNSKIRNCAYGLSESAKRLGRAVNDIGELFSIYNGDFALSESEYEFEETMLYLRSVLEDKTARTGSRFSIDIDKRIPLRLIGDSARINEILGRLIENAAAVSGSGKIRFSVSCLAEQNDRVFLKFTISDSGKGEIGPQLKTMLLIADYVAGLLNGKLSVRKIEGFGCDISWLITQGRGNGGVLDELAVDLEHSIDFDDVVAAADCVVSRARVLKDGAMEEFIEKAETKTDMAAYYLNMRDYKNCVQFLNSLAELAEKAGADNIVEKTVELGNAAKYGCYDVAVTRMHELSSYVLRLLTEVKTIQEIKPEDTKLAHIDNGNLVEILDEIEKNLDEYRLEKVEELYYCLAQLNTGREDITEKLSVGEEMLMDMDVLGLKQILADVRRML